jgi:hypothetical protein
VNGTTNEFGYLSSASFQLSQKISELEGYRDKVSTFCSRVESFRDLAYDEESGLADRLYSNSNQFMDEMGITPEYEKGILEKFAEGFVDGVAAIYNAVVDFGESIVEWFEEHPIVGQILTVIGEVALVVVAAVAFVATLPASGVLGVLAAIGAGWALFKASTDLVCDSAALGAYIAGDEETGDYLADYDAHDLFHDSAEWAGNGLNDVFGVDFFDDVFVFQADLAYFSLDAIEFATSFYAPGAGDIWKGFDYIELGGNILTDIPEKGIMALGNIGDFALGEAFDGNDIADRIKTGIQGAPDIISDFSYFVQDFGGISPETGDAFRDRMDNVSNLLSFTDGNPIGTVFGGLDFVIPDIGLDGIHLDNIHINAPGASFPTIEVSIAY